MLVTLEQYKREEVDFDDERTAGRSQTEDAIDTSAEEYFGRELDADLVTWETVEYRDDPVQRREVTLDGVTAVSITEASSGDADLPGGTVQVRRDGDVEDFENAALVEAEDADPG